MPRWRNSAIQSVLFDTAGWTRAAAEQWARRHGFNVGQVDETDGYIRLRQFEPEGFRDFRTIDFNERLGIKAVLGKLNPHGDEGQLVKQVHAAGATFRLYDAGEETEGYNRFRLYIGDEEVLSVLWPDEEAEEVWDHLGAHWVMYWELHTGD